VRPSKTPEVTLAAEARPLSKDGQGENLWITERSAGRPIFGGSKERLSFHQSSIWTYNETKKESRSMSAPSFEESLVQHTIWAPSPLV
jgi:hypothetical protein